MKWKPKHRKIEDIMKEIGFISINRGWALPRKKQSSKPIRYHVAPCSEGYDLHADYEVNGKHVTGRSASRDMVFVEILNAVDMGEKPTVSKKFKNNYKTLLLKTK